MGRFVGKKISDWGEYVYVKTNAAELLRKELPKKLKDKGREKEVFLSSVTDPYQGLEAKYQITRKCLEELNRFGFEGTTSILTKSDLVTRDIDILKKLQAIVGVTIISTGDSISRYFEKYAPSVSQRFNALKKLNENGLRTYAFIGPLLPHFVAKPKELEEIFQNLLKLGRKIFSSNILIFLHILEAG